MDKTALEQYIELREEIRDLHDRIDRDERRLARIKKEGMVSDTVKGTRKDGTIGPIKITGYPTPETWQVESMIRKRVAKLCVLEEDLQAAVNAVDDFIEHIPNSEIRIMLRLYYLDDLTWSQVAIRMNYRFPRRRIKYTEDSCRKRHDRYLEKIF
jgi:hypothetical protein